MRKCTAIIVRHGGYARQKFGDGPLTEGGVETVEGTANVIIGELEMLCSGIDLALISGSLRGMDTFVTIQKEMMHPEVQIDVAERLIHTDFYSSAKEAGDWRKLHGPDSEAYFPDFTASCEIMAEELAILKHAPHLFTGPANRVVEAIREAQARGKTTFLIVTHGGYEQVIVKALTGENCETLGLGKHMTIKFD
ncbi:histidine phosphatase family protein [Candidatus Kuenenbacteria bacterium]|nr:histidine phosphatase family protein [Candidatus Kuenenbacteria bacterium]